MKTTLLWVASLTIFLGGMLHAQDISGNWQGTLQAGKGLRIVIKIAKDDGKLKATMYSIDQSAQIPITSIAFQGASLNYGIKALDLTYAGTLNPDGNTIAGNQTQGGQSFVLNLTRVDEENTWAIPETPKPMAADAKPGFEVATVKPSEPGKPGKYLTYRGRHLLAGNYSLNDLVGFAYDLHFKQIAGAPEWASTALFDIDGVPDVAGQPDVDQMKGMLKELLSDRFQLTIHRETRELAVYALTVAKGDPRLARSASDANALPSFLFRGLGKLTVANMTMAEFAAGMGHSVMDKPVVDQTGLTGRYDFALNWTPDDSQFTQFRTGTAPRPPDDPNAPPSLYTAIREQLNLKLDPVKAPIDVVVIDHVEKPSEN